MEHPPHGAGHGAEADERGAGGVWRTRIDILVHHGLVALLVACTLNGFSFEWGVLGSEITIRPDQVVLVFLAPLLALLCITGRFRVHFMLFDWVVVGFVLGNVAASTFFSPVRLTSLKGALLLAGYAAMYFVVKLIVANRGDMVRRASSWAFGLGITQAAYSVAAVVVYALGYAIGGVQIGHLFETSVATEGTFWEANLLGAYLGLMVVVLTIRYLFRSSTQSGAIYLFGLFAASLALPLTMTRAAGVAAVLGVLAIARIGWLCRREIPEWRTRTGKIVVTLGCVLLLSATAMNALVSTLSRYPNVLLERWAPMSWIPASEEAKSRTVEQASHSSVDGRLDAWVRALDTWREKPILGHGTLAGASVVKGGWWYSSLVQALYDTGFVGFSLLLWIHLGSVVYPVWAWVRIRRKPMSEDLLAFGAGNAVLFFTSQFSSFLFVGFPWVFLGLSMGAVEAWKGQREVL